MKPLLAFHNDPSIKRKYLSRVRRHRKLDEIIHGRYWEDGKGCAVGCTIHGSDHASYESELGIPEVLAHLEDGIFESLSNGLALDWPERFLSAIKPGADLSKVWPQFAVWLLVDPVHGVLQFTNREDGRKAIQAVADGYQMVIDGKGTPDWVALRAEATWGAAEAAARAAGAAAAGAAGAAAGAAGAAGAGAAEAAEARTNHRIAQADKLVELLKAAA